MLVVKSMLLTGFDAPIEGVMYLDRPIREAELLQAIARVNRTGFGKRCGIVVDYYGAMTPVIQLASLTVPEPRMAVISPYDKASMGSIERAIRDSDLGVNPTNDGNVIRISFPQLTEERRRE